LRLHADFADARFMSSAPALGRLMSKLRARMGWTLREMSAASRIPLSTLAKVEQGRLTLSYDKVQQVCAHLSIRLSDLLLLDNDGIVGRRSVSRSEDCLRVRAHDRDYCYPAIDIEPKMMAPTVMKVRAKPNIEERCFSAHAGEEYIHVLEGRLEVHTEFYAPAVLETGESIYIDANMAHAFFAGPECEETTCLVVLSRPGLQPSAPLHQLHSGGGASEGRNAAGG
jgi:transcriptional regulator with XRE-family HTH domain